MKVIRTLIIWIIISLMIQIGGLFYLDKFYFASDVTLKSKKVELKPVSTKPKIVIKVDENAKKFNVSYGGKYLSYYDSNTLKIIDTDTGNSDSVSINSGSSLSFYKWLPDRNRIIISEKTVSKSSASFRFFSYDADKKNLEELKDIVHNKDLTVKSQDTKAEIKDISFSVVTNVMYAQLVNSNNHSYIYRSDIMSEMSKLQTSVSSIGNLVVTPTIDTLFYEDLINKKIRTTSGSLKNSSLIKSPCLLGTDKDNNIYIGEIENGLVEKIYYGNESSGIDSWDSVELAQGTEKGNINISMNGEIYVNDSSKDAVTELESHKDTKYSGVFKTIYNSGVISVENGELVKTSFK